MMTPDELAGFDVNGPGLEGQLFGLPFTPEGARVVIVPVPWEATASYGVGTADGPQAVLNASRQVDFFVRDIPEAWKLGISMLPIPVEIRKDSERIRSLIDQLSSHNRESESSLLSPKVNEALESLTIYVKKTTQALLKQGKLVGVLGGDHSSPLGFIRSLSEVHDRFGILQIDAHADLRKNYQGFAQSHGSIMYNALKTASVSRLVQVGIRDICDEEIQTIKRGMGRVKTYFDDDLKDALARNTSWESICTNIVRDLPDKVYISFDIDGLDPKLCPNTGTPVPGGLEFYHVVSLLKSLVTSGKTIVGFDLCEVAAHEWDANVGSRILWQLCNWMGVSNKLLEATRS